MLLKARFAPGVSSFSLLVIKDDWGKEVKEDVEL
jgi:hypothetical protein